MASELSCKKSENREIIKHDPNMWEDDFLQSLSSPYGEPLYREKVASLIEEIKQKAFNPLIKDEEIWAPTYDLIQRFFLVDAVQRLGIHRYFEEEIKKLLDYTYKHWNENGISWGSQNSTADLHSTALGFRVLRLNEYHVSQEVFKTFWDENGRFSLRPENQLRSVLSLYEAAEISFPGETILGEAKSFASDYLQQTLAENQNIRDKSQLLIEVEYLMKTSWKARNPRWEAWNSIQICRQDIDSWMSMEGVYRMSNEISKVILEAAILDFNIRQAQHQIELKIVSKWWSESSVKQLNYFRHRFVEYYIAYAFGLYEFEYSRTQIGFVKFDVMVTVIDDMFDTYGTLDDLVYFKTALINWDMSMLANLPQLMQICFQFLHETYMELADAAEKIHCPRARKWMEDYWINLILAQWEDVGWNVNDCHPTLNQYLNNFLNSTFIPIVTLFPMLLINTFLPDDIIERISKFEYDVAMGCRLIDDLKEF